MNTVNLASNIKHIRKQAKISQQDLADKSGISKAQISRLESGQQDNPQINTIIAIASSLNVSIEEIVYGTKIEKSFNLEKLLGTLPIKKQIYLKKLIRAWVLISEYENFNEQE